MKRSELKQIIREVIEESYSNYAPGSDNSSAPWNQSPQRHHDAGGEYDVEEDNDESKALTVKYFIDDIDVTGTYDDGHTEYVGDFTWSAIDPESYDIEYITGIASLDVKYDAGADIWVYDNYTGESPSDASDSEGDYLGYDDEYLIDVMKQHINAINLEWKRQRT